MIEEIYQLQDQAKVDLNSFENVKAPRCILESEVELRLSEEVFLFPLEVMLISLLNFAHPPHHCLDWQCIDWELAFSLLEL